MSSAGDVTEGEPDARDLGRDLFHSVLVGGGVDVDRQQRYPEAASFGDQEPAWVHARVVFEDAGEELDRIVSLQPGALVGRQREAGPVGFAEPERPKGDDIGPDAVDVAIPEQPPPPFVDAGRGPGAEAGFDGGGVGGEGTADLVGFGEADVHAVGQHSHQLLVVDQHPVGLGEERPEPGVEVGDLGVAEFGVDERGDHVRLHRAGPEQGDVRDQVLVLIGLHLPEQFPLPG